MSPTYPIRAVSKLTALSIDTLRAWERRYRAVVPNRLERGRSYTQQNIQRLILLRELVQRGHAIGQIAALGDNELRGMLESATPITETESLGLSSVEALLDAFANFEVWRANEELGRLAALLSPRDLVFRIVLPLMREVGDRWHRGQFGIAQEHLVSTAIRNLFGSMIRLYPPQPGAPKMLIATLAGELHEFGILASGMIATINGLNPLILGPNLPVEELAEASRKTSAAIVVVGCSGGAPPENTVMALRSGLPSEVELWIGGTSSSFSGPSILFFPEMEAFENACRNRAMTIQ